jgi:hypothetical protein
MREDEYMYLCNITTIRYGYFHHLKKKSLCVFPDTAEKFTSWWPGIREREYWKGPRQDMAPRTHPKCPTFNNRPTSYILPPFRKSIDQFRVVCGSTL